jgi:hypothetical protein
MSLFFFAATADFISTSIITEHYNANNPPVRIEHKCAGHWGSVTHQSESAAPVDIIVASAEPIATIQLSLPAAASSLDSISDFCSASSSPPLRC